MEIAKKKWDEHNAVLKVTGRDFEGKTYAIHFNEVTNRWENLGEEKEVRASAEDSAYETDLIVKAIRDNLNRVEGSFIKRTEDEELDEPVIWRTSLQDLADIVQYEYGDSTVTSSRALGSRLRKLAYPLEHKDNITFESSREGSGYIYTFSRPCMG